LTTRGRLLADGDAMTPILTKKGRVSLFFVFDAIFAELFSRFNVHSFRAFGKIVAKRAV